MGGRSGDNRDSLRQWRDAGRDRSSTRGGAWDAQLGNESVNEKNKPLIRGLAAAMALGAAGLVQLPAHAQEVTGNADDAKTKISMCIGCHEIPGYRASFPSVYQVPMLYGQSSKYIEAALQAYRKGDRSHPTMRAVAGSLSDKDIADLAAYYGTK